jgi:hypothetical protein
MKTRDILLLAAAGFAAFQLAQSARQRQIEREMLYRQLDPRLPPPPPVNTPEWFAWVQFTTQLGLDIAGLFGPGGPFHKANPQLNEVDWSNIQTAAMYLP